jgi:hypothetical protein
MSSARSAPPPATPAWPPSAPGAEARAAQGRGQHEQASWQQELAASYQALHDIYTERETVFAAVMADRADWDAATRAQRHLAVAADAELRRRHPARQYPPLRSAEPPRLTSTQRGELTLTTGEQARETGQWIKDLALQHRAFAAKLADRQSLTFPSEDPDYGDLGQAFPRWPAPARDAILQPPSPRSSPQRGSWNAHSTTTWIWKPQTESNVVTARAFPRRCGYHYKLRAWSQAPVAAEPISAPGSADGWASRS